MTIENSVRSSVIYNHYFGYGRNQIARQQTSISRTSVGNIIKHHKATLSPRQIELATELRYVLQFYLQATRKRALGQSDAFLDFVVHTIWSLEVGYFDGRIKMDFDEIVKTILSIAESLEIEDPLTVKKITKPWGIRMLMIYATGNFLICHMPNYPFWS